MNKNKNIDDLFREHLKDFEKKPEDDIWQAIESRLSEKKKRKPVFIWYNIAGLAALFLLLISIGINVYKNDDKQLREIVIQPNKNNINLKNNKNITLQSVEKRNTINNKEQTNDNTKKLTTKNNFNNSLKNQLVVTHKQVINQKFASTEKKIKSLKNQEYIAINDVEHIINNDIVIIDDKHKKNEVEVFEKEQLNIGVLALKEDSEKINIETILTDKEEENTKEKQTKIKKLSIGSSFSPIYYSSLTKGSSIDENIASNSTSNEYSSSYGVKIEYKVSNKWSIQTGIHNVNLNHTTNNVVATIFEPIAGSDPFSNIQSVSNKLVILTPINNSASLISIQDDINLEDSNKILTANGKLTQNVGYIEIPLEVKYTLIEKKIDVQISGGFSTLLLNKNELVLDNNTNSFLLGKATNINNTSFSANLGVDFKYDISKKLFINLSPNFKYQINTFSDNDGGFSPYQIGINTGLNFKF